MSLQSVVQIRDVGLVMFVVMNLHGFGIDGRLQGVVIVGKFGQGKALGVIGSPGGKGREGQGSRPAAGGNEELATSQRKHVQSPCEKKLEAGRPPAGCRPTP